MEIDSREKRNEEEIENNTATTCVYPPLLDSFIVSYVFMLQ